MFDCHQAEITVMQFTGHSLPVHQSMTVPRDFNPVPYGQPSSPTLMEYATSASLEWHVWPGRKSIYNTSVCGSFGSVIAQFEFVNHKSPKLDYIARLNVRLSNYTRSEAMHNVSAHQLPRYYQTQQITATK